MEVTVLDSSAVVAIVLNEKPRTQLLRTIQHSARPVMSSVSLYEAAVAVLRRRGAEAVREMMTLLDLLGVTIEGFDSTSALLSLDAYAKFGRGFHPIGLNPGDCPVYALAALHGAPVLSTSEEFTRAGITSAL